MVREIRIYAEGGGDGKDTKARLREGFGTFFTELRVQARERAIRWDIIVCGGRGRAYDRFAQALTDYPHATSVLLVDAEAQVISTPWSHVQSRDGWVLHGTSDDQCHLMVQVMESWFLADVDALAGFYGQDFNRNPVPKQADIEVIPKATVYSALNLATKDTQKGEYHEIRHGARLLCAISPELVRSRSKHCDRLFSELAGKIAEP